MAIHRSYLRQRAEYGPDERARGSRQQSVGSLLGKAVQLVLTGSSGDQAEPGHELQQLELPDLLTPQAGPGPDAETLLNLLDLAFLGRASAGEIDRELDAMPVATSRWVAAHFADDLFLEELVRSCLRVEIRGRRAPQHRQFLTRVLTSPPPAPDCCRYRQAILRELEEQPQLATATEQLFAAIVRLLTLLRASRDDARLEPLRYRLDVLRGFRSVVEQMADHFAAARSGLHRLHEVGDTMRSSAAFLRMVALLDHHAGMAKLRLAVVIGADGKLRHLEIEQLHEQKRNPFYRGPLRRWWDRLRLLLHRYHFEPEELVDRLVLGVYQEIAPALALVVQLLCHLEVYLAARSFAAAARARGLAVCLPELERGARLQLRGLFNPLLLPLMERPVPSDLEMQCATPVTLVTGPNSGGKTRLLQAVGITQVLGQSGLYVPSATARLPFVDGLFASIIELDRADQPEGRLGTELVRLRTLFEQVPAGSLVLLDELCSGTNPSEAIEIVDMVLRLLRQLAPVGFVTTHFLDFAQQLWKAPSPEGFVFLQAEVEQDRGATFRFVPGVAATSLAVGTAQRLGVTFHELEQKLVDRIMSCSDGLPEQ